MSHYYRSINVHFEDVNIKIILFLGEFGDEKLSPLLRGVFAKIGRIFDQFGRFFAIFALFSVKIVYIFVRLAKLSVPAAISPEPFL